MTAAITTTAPRPTLEELVVRLIDAIFGDGALEVRAMLGMRWRPGRLVTRWAGWSRPAASSSGDGVDLPEAIRRLQACPVLGHGGVGDVAELATRPNGRSTFLSLLRRAAATAR